MKIVISGLGVMGASLAMALKNNNFNGIILGHDFPEIIKQAKKLSIIDDVIDSWPQDCKGADIIFLCTPIKVIKEQLASLNNIIDKNTIVTDLGSTKTELLKFSRNINFSGNYVGGHPMTGAEKTGIKAANPLLYENAIYILTNENLNNPTKSKLIKLLELVKARIYVLDSQTHDKIMAHISHLPQLIAISLVNYTGRKENQNFPCFELAAGGFRDLTRIASSSALVWKDIIETNYENIAEVLDSFISELMKVKDQRGNIEKTFENANQFRMQIPDYSKGFINPLTDILVYVDDKKGVIFRISSILFKNNIDIRDIELLKIREKEGGVFRLSFQDKTVAEEAVKVLGSINYKATIKE